MKAQSATIIVDPSQFPEIVRRELLAALRAGFVPPKFHYESMKQAGRWLALHEAHSPARTDDDCRRAYDEALAAAADAAGGAVTVIGLGAGGGQKEARLLTLLARKKAPITYAPCDVSVPLVLTAQRNAEAAAPGVDCRPLVCNLATAEDLPATFDRLAPRRAGVRRIVTCFGMMPNFEPGVLLAALAGLTGADDLLLLSANLAPGPDYDAGVRRVLPGYDNELTREWLFTFLADLGVERGDGAMGFAVEDSPEGLKRIAVDFRFDKTRELKIEGVVFQKGASLRLFFSYRHTPARVAALLEGRGLEIAGQWIAASGEEGVFLCRQRAAAP